MNNVKIFWVSACMAAEPKSKVSVHEMKRIFDHICSYANRETVVMQLVNCKAYRPLYCMFDECLEFNHTALKQLSFF